MHSWYVVFSSTELGRETEAINSKIFHSKISNRVSETFLMEEGSLEKRRKATDFLLVCSMER